MSVKTGIGTTGHSDQKPVGKPQAFCFAKIPHRLICAVKCYFRRILIVEIAVAIRLTQNTIISIAKCIPMK